jgi:undecaprenyl-diphosphatase
LWDYFKDEGGTLTSQELTLLGVGNVVAFLVSMLAIRGFIGYLTKNGFKIFGYYRIAIGLIILALWAIGYFDGVDMSNF